MDKNCEGDKTQRRGWLFWFLLGLVLGGCGTAEKAPECQQGWKRCNGVTVQTCNPNTLRWRNAINCLEAGYDDCAEVTVRYADDSAAPPMCKGQEPAYSTCATEDSRQVVWVKDFICVDRGLPGQG